MNASLLYILLFVTAFGSGIVLGCIVYKKREQKPPAGQAPTARERRKRIWIAICVVGFLGTVPFALPIMADAVIGDWRALLPLLAWAFLLGTGVCQYVRRPTLVE